MAHSSPNHKYAIKYYCQNRAQPSKLKIMSSSPTPGRNFFLSIYDQTKFYFSRVCVI